MAYLLALDPHAGPEVKSVRAYIWSADTLSHSDLPYPQAEALRHLIVQRAGASSDEVIPLSTIQHENADVFDRLLTDGIVRDLIYLTQIEVFGSLYLDCSLYQTILLESSPYATDSSATESVRVIHREGLTRRLARVVDREVGSLRGAWTGSRRIEVTDRSWLDGVTAVSPMRQGSADQLWPWGWFIFKNGSMVRMSSYEETACFPEDIPFYRSRSASHAVCFTRDDYHWLAMPWKNILSWGRSVNYQDALEHAVEFMPVMVDEVMYAEHESHFDGIEGRRLLGAMEETAVIPAIR